MVWVMRRVVVEVKMMTLIVVMMMFKMLVLMLEIVDGFKSDLR